MGQLSLSWFTVRPGVKHSDPLPFLSSSNKYLLSSQSVPNRVQQWAKPLSYSRAGQGRHAHNEEVNGTLHKKVRGVAMGQGESSRHNLVKLQRPRMQRRWTDTLLQLWNFPIHMSTMSSHKLGQEHCPWRWMGGVSDAETSWLPRQQLLSPCLPEGCFWWTQAKVEHRRCPWDLGTRRTSVSPWENLKEN